jgi:hypothetical protein
MIGCPIVTSEADGRDRTGEDQSGRIVRSDLRQGSELTGTDRRLMATRGGLITGAGGSSYI